MKLSTWAFKIFLKNNFRLQQRSKILLRNFDKSFKESTKEHRGVLCQERGKKKSVGADHIRP